MAQLRLKQLDSVLTGSLQVSGSSGVTGSLSVSSTGSFGKVIATTLSGDGSDLTNVFEGTTPSASISTRLTTEEANVDTLQSTMTSEQTNIDNLQTDSGSFSTRITNATSSIAGLVTDSGSFSSRITTAESELGNTLISSSAQIASDISGSFIGGFEYGGTISGSSTSTGSFGYLSVSGNSNFTGDLTLGGNIQIGDADTDSITISSDLTSNLIPNADSTYDIGSTSKNWRYGYIEQVVATHVTASGHISASLNITGSDIYSSGRIYEAGSSVIDHATAMAIVFGG